MSETRKLAAIPVDVVGYSRLAGLRRGQDACASSGTRSDLIDPSIAACHGCIVKRTKSGRFR
jgi:hypothetical protein